MLNTVKIYDINFNSKYQLIDAITFEGETLEDFYNYIMEHIKEDEKCINLNNFRMDYRYYMIINKTILGTINFHKGWTEMLEANVDEIKLIKKAIPECNLIKEEEPENPDNNENEGETITE